MDQETKDLLTRIAHALERIAAKPVILDTKWVWDETDRKWKLSSNYETDRNAS